VRAGGDPRLPSGARRAKGLQMRPLRRAEGCNGNCTGTVSGAMGQPFLHTLRVRYGECDPQGVVFNAHYLAYFDIALTEMWRHTMDGGYKEMTDRGVDLVVAEATCRYRAPAGFDDVLDIAMSVAHLGTTSMRTAIEITREGTTVVEGELRHVFIDLETRAKTAIPDWVRVGLGRWAAEERPRVG
jgi:acyl-CoA thioester hydrolase